MKKLPIQVFGDEGEYYNSIDLMGYTCLEQDCLYPDYKGNIAVGNYILFGNVGGYSLVSKPPFIQPNCAVIEISNDDNVALIKRQETNEDIFLTFVF
jgi:diaminopimelate decarboxylase